MIGVVKQAAGSQASRHRGRVLLHVLCGAVLLAVAGASLCAAGERSDRRALSHLFGNGLRRDALDVVRRAHELPPEERFRLLHDDVFPPQTTQVRLSVAFLPTDPAPPVAEQWAAVVRPPEAGAGLVPLGGMPVSPAAELVRLAADVGHLDVLKESLQQRNPQGDEARKARLALEILVHWQARDFERALPALAEFTDLARNAPHGDRDRTPETIVLWEGLRTRESLFQIYDLVYVVYEQTHTDGIPHAERLKRHISSLKFQIDALLGPDRVLPNLPADDQPAAPSPEPRFTQWHAVSRCTAETRGKGFPTAVWTRQGATAEKRSGHDHDYLYFAIPLRGDFEVQADLSTFAYREIRLGLGTQWVGPRFTLNDCQRGDFRRAFPFLPLEAPLTEMGSRLRVRTVVRDGVRTSYANGRPIFTAPHGPDSDPWLSLHCAWYTYGIVENLHITGTPEIPEEIDLIAQDDLPGWLPYFDESAGAANSDWRLETDPGEGTPILVGGARPYLRGAFQESLLRYHRPMFEDGTIEYEFYYDGEHAVFPALDRLCFLFGGARTGIHWLTDGRFDRTGLAPDNLTRPPMPESRPVPLTADAWNHVRLTVQGDTAEVAVNGETVLTRELAPGNRRTFGLFHYSDQTEARVRQLRWRGTWPLRLPSGAAQELADPTRELELERWPELPIVFEHDFAKGLPKDAIWGAGENWESHVAQEADGVRLSRDVDANPFDMLSLPLSLQGDFDITLAYRDFQLESTVAGEGNIQLQVYLDDDVGTECRLYRNHFHHEKRNDERLVQAAVFRQDTPQGRFDFPARAAEESTAGRMRIVRRGTEAFYLHAEADSPQFRLVHRETVTGAPVSYAGIKAVIETLRGGRASVVWKWITVRAAQPPAIAQSPMLTVAELDAQREQLADAVQLTLKDAADAAQVVVTGISENLTREETGWLLQVPPTKQWTHTGVSPRLGLSGDFDVTLDLDVLKLDPTDPHAEATVLVRAFFNNAIHRGLEIKYSNSAAGVRELEIQRDSFHRNGKGRYEKVLNQQADVVTQLRLARRGEIVYLLYRGAAGTEQQILGRMEFGANDVTPRALEAMAHTGSGGTETVVRFKSMRLHAQQILSP